MRFGPISEKIVPLPFEVYPMVRPILLLTCVLTCGCGGQPNESPRAAADAPAAPAVPPALTIHPLALPAMTGTEPQLTVSSKGAIFSWVEQNGSTATLKFAERSGAAWSDARTIATGKDWFVT